ncbi:protein MIZU-KUSSEI 1-like [Magnolia sinica]|uniref:protein MIZU-KUSSEI 1-like n=1 Tax=Magnolia sinica TaxID=86752 RepID=UPI00265B6C52|nr:protein MIZU-KUSSEI 1-like [Magnolia sinica]
MAHFLSKFRPKRPQPQPQPQQQQQQQPRPPISLLQPSKKHSWRTVRILKIFRSAFRSFPIIAPNNCKLPSRHPRDLHISGGIRLSGTLFGHRKARITLAIQENPRCLPMLLLELAIPTGKLLQEMASGLVRIALECDKRPADKTKLLDEPIWTMYCNGRKTGYGTKRDPNEEDLNVMELLRAMSMGAGVLPNGEEGESPDGEFTYMRAHFERVIGSRDSETFYMLNPDGNSGPELSIFFVRV